MISEAGGTTVDFNVLPIVAELEGIIGYPEGSTPALISVILRVQTTEGEVWRLTTPTDGVFLFEGIPAGTGTIDIDAHFLNHRRISTTVPVDIPEGDTGYVEVQL